MALKDLIYLVATLQVCFIEKGGNKHPSNKTVWSGFMCQGIFFYLDCSCAMSMSKTGKCKANVL